MTKWILLLLAIGFEVSGTTCMKLSNGLTRLAPTVAMFALYGLSFCALSLTLKQLAVSTAYAIWSGLGTAIIAVIGILVFKEDVTWFKGAGLLFVIAGIVMLNLSGPNH